MGTELLMCLASWQHPEACLHTSGVPLCGCGVLVASKPLTASRGVAVQRQPLEAIRDGSGGNRCLLLSLGPWGQRWPLG